MNSWKNNGKLKLAIIVGTRPEIIRLSATIKKCRLYFDTLLIHTGQNYDYNLNEVFFKDLEIDAPDLNLEVKGDDLGDMIGAILSKSYKALKKLNPNALLVLGDTNSCLSAISAKRLHIPIFHMEAGNRCRDERLPEETNRRIVDIISDVNMAYSEQARRWLRDCGLPPERTFVTGSPMAEVLSENLKKIESSDICRRLTEELGVIIETGKYILLSAHREENIDDDEQFISLFDAVNVMAEKYQMPVIYSCHPRSKKRLETKGFILHRNVYSHSPMGFHDYNHLQMNSYVTVSDSGTLPEESAYFSNIGKSFPAVCIRSSTERQEAMEKGCFILSGITETGLLQSVDMAIKMRNKKDYSADVPDYSDLNVSTKVVKIIQSYTGVVDKFVWRK
ncbi:non-hydrolyzing UDP-N-acetylglucosamine 2-epimerase [Oribacterium sp. P6A1]|uniref:non-hydrolyzing UDP-N-acetylglucosamine 2-epimerase n=1 Tax=Oribacterium sp. P6A1 TaxID=1410612 RepID=UPI00055BEA2F|nr:UDP-N-acetylglucosamine 2-epimerase (non-hydrolyzing) [Oribacterium sp. P6A1]